ncbi:MAG: acyltransferase [Bacteroidaceae bacterium]|nr:acyltransferase [Bacteroidaceae bacterium]
MFTSKSQRTVWFDVVRLVAFLLLLGCHATDPINAAATYGNAANTSTPEQIAWATIWGTFVRPCVPLFVMLTGALLLPVKTSMRDFYKRRIPRVFWPFVLWSVLYYLTPWLTGVLGADRSMVYYLFSWAETDSQAFSDGLLNVARIPLTFPYLASHMWYIYLLVGLYLFMPIFSTWVSQATKREKEWVLLLWGVSTALPYVTEFLSPYAFGTCSWNSFGTFYYFAGFNGYLLLGHYVAHHVKWSALCSFVVALPLMLVGGLVSYYGYSHMVALPHPTPEQVELFWTYCTPNVAAMSIAWMLMLKHVQVRSTLLCGVLQSLTACGFGIYMVHYFFVRPCHDIVASLSLPTPLSIPASACLMLLVSWLTVLLLKRIFKNKARFVVG